MIGFSNWEHVQWDQFLQRDHLSGCHSEVSRTLKNVQWKGWNLDLLRKLVPVLTETKQNLLWNLIPITGAMCAGFLFIHIVYCLDDKRPLSIIKVALLPFSKSRRNNAKSCLSFQILLCHVQMMLLGSSWKLLKLWSISSSSFLQTLTHRSIVALLKALIARILLIVLVVIFK